MPDNKMNEAQQRAVMHGEGPLLVLAGPGSGKTFVITNRILHLIDQRQVAPERILVITFTKEAALSMERRFHQISPHKLPVNFGTFHSIFYHILKQSNAISNHSILKDSQKRRLILPILQKLLPTEEKESCSSEDAIQVLSAISYYKNTGSLEKAAEKLTGNWKTSFEDICQQYEHARQNAGSIDFDDMVYLCHELLLKNRQLRSYWQSRFEHILMDEFQDINPLQYQVIKLLAPIKNNLFAVGDDDQAIYGFRGSSPACLRLFEEEFHAGKIYLNMNYRSYGAIVEASCNVIKENVERFSKELTAWKKQEKESVKLHSFPEREEQYEYLLKRLSEPSKESRAVLFRTNAYLQGFAVRMSRYGIAFEMKEKAQGIYEHFICKDVMTYLQLAEGEYLREPFLFIMNKPSRYISREALSGDTIQLDAVREFYRCKEIESCGKKAEYRSGWQKKEAQRIGEIQKNIDRLERDLKYLKQSPPHLAVRYLCKAMGYEQYLRELSGGRRERQQEWMEYIEWLISDAAQFAGITQWIQAQADYAKALEEGKRMGREQLKQPLSDAIVPVQLMTAHASKGLEFDSVWIPDCNEKIYPHGKIPDEQTCEEERRIFYVAMTRAKKSLELLYLTGTKERPRLPSRFLQPLLTDAETILLLH